MCGTCWQLVANLWDFFVTQVWAWFRKKCRGGWFARLLCKIAKFFVALISTLVAVLLSVVLGIVCSIVCAFCFILWLVVCILDSVFTDQKCPDALDTCMTVFGSARPGGGSGSGTGTSGLTPATGTGAGVGLSGGGSGPRVTPKVAYCGCAESGLFLLAACVAYGGYVLATGTAITGSVIGTWAAIAIVAGALGKGFGVLRAVRP